MADDLAPFLSTALELDGRPFLLVYFKADLDLDGWLAFPSLPFYAVWEGFEAGFSCLTGAFAACFFAGDFDLGAEADLFAFESGFEFLAPKDTAL